MKKKYGVFLVFAVLLIAAAFIFAACSDPNNDKKDDPAKVATPVAIRAAGAVFPGTSVTLTSSTTGAEIRYTTDETTPTATTGTVYSTPISITVETTIKAIAVKSGMTDSDVLTAAYTIATGGNYTGYAHGVNNVPVTPIELNVTVGSDGKITAATIEHHNESVYYQTNVVKAVANPGDSQYVSDLTTPGSASMIAKLLNKKAEEIGGFTPATTMTWTGVDGTTGASISSAMIKLAAKEALYKAAPITAPMAGTYTGVGFSRYGTTNQRSVTVVASVTVANNVPALSVTSITPDTAADFYTGQEAALKALFNAANSYIITPITTDGTTPITTGTAAPAWYKAQFGAMEAVKDIMIQAGYPASAFKERPADIPVPTGTATVNVPGSPAVGANVTVAATVTTPAGGIVLHRLYRDRDTDSIWAGVSELSSYPLVDNDNGRQLKVKVGTSATGYWGGYFESTPTSVGSW